jgi:hypothetical protein
MSTTKHVVLALFSGFLKFWFDELRKAGLSEDEVVSLYNKTRAEFLSSNPAKLPEV